MGPRLSGTDVTDKALQNTALASALSDGRRSLAGFIVAEAPCRSIGACARALQLRLGTAYGIWRDNG